MTATGDEIAQLARTALGTQYVWGGNSLSSGVDCSGLVQQVYGQLGIAMPRTTYNQINVGASVGMGDLRVGDLVFFDTDKSMKGPDHVGIYIGGGQFIHAPRTGDVVKVSSLADSYYAQRFMGGRRIPGVITNGNDTSPEQLAQVSQQQALEPKTAQELAETYGMSYSFFSSQPELKKLLGSAVAEQWSPDRWTAELKNTKWWKDTSESRRQAQILQKTDPATYKANLAAARASLEAQAVQMGAILSPRALDQGAQSVMTLGWNDAQIQNFLGQYIGFNDQHVIGGQAGAAYKAIAGEAYAQGVQLSDQTIKNQVAYIGRGLTSLQDVLGSIQQQAAGAYPAFAPQLQAGAKMADIASPYVETLAKELDLPQGSVNLTDSRVKAALNRRTQDGSFEPMSLSDFTAQVRSDPAWSKTDAAMGSVMNVGHEVLKSMGLVS